MNKIPYCSQCCHCEQDKFQNTASYDCNYNPYACKKSISVDKLPKTSPKWCPLREQRQ